MADTQNHIMAGHSDSNDKYDTMGPIETKISEYLKLLDDTVCWWKANQNAIHTDPAVVAKCSRIILQLAHYRDEFCQKFEMLRQQKPRVIELYRSHGCESPEFKAAEKKVHDAQRELARTMDNAGHFFQALVTKWFHEDSYFTIMDVEVKRDGHDYDMGIADKRGHEYDVEIWHGHTKRHHATRESTALVGDYGGNIHCDRGSVPKRLRDAATGLGSVSTDSTPDRPKIVKKLGQLRDNHTGFLIECRTEGGFPTMGTESDFPRWPEDSLPTNKCIVVLDFSGELTFGKRGAGHAVSNPHFAHLEVAKRIIRSLGFRYDPGRCA